MLDSVVRLVVGNTAMGGAKKPLELMSEEELEAELRRQVLEAAMGMQKLEVIDEVRNLSMVDSGSGLGLSDGAVPEIPASRSGPDGRDVSDLGTDGLLRGVE
jgi:hypothetical protein